MSDHRHLIPTPQTSKSSSAFQAAAVAVTPTPPPFNPALMAAAAAASNFKYHDLASAAAVYHQQNAAALAAAVGLSPAAASRSAQSTPTVQRLPQQQALKAPMPSNAGLMMGRDIFQQQQQHNLARLGAGLKQGVFIQTFRRSFKKSILLHLVLPSNNLANYLAAAATNHQAAVAATAAQIQQNLKVEDALSYLEQVKLQFRNKPDVYNNFLDIMKDFKSANLDTPGVIQKVSQLFRGHPTLIIGFNTFLPPGFKIEANGDGSDRISILLPDGQSHLITCGDDPPTPVQNHESTMNQPSNRSVIMNTQIAKPALQQPAQQQPPFEFNQAINYVNKIKNRYLHQPEVYKNFLDILHRYQKEQREIKEGTLQPGRKTLSEREVYDMVANLFANEPDLLREFSQFLPDASSTGGFLHQHQQQHGPPIPQLLEPSPPRPPPQALQPAVVLLPPPDAQPPQPALAKLQIDTPKRPASPMTPMEEASPPKKQFKIDIVNHDLSSIDAANCGSLQEFDIFDKIKRTLNDEETYKNFVRSLVLYNKEIVSKYEFLSILAPFFCNCPDMMKFMAQFLNCHESTSSTGPVYTTNGENAQLPGLIDAELYTNDKLNETFEYIINQERVYNNGKNQQQQQQDRMMISSDLAMEIDYASCKREGVSYRALPATYVQPHCSGRTELCCEVLNDTWVSFPSWQSEDSSTVSSKKTQFEESMYRTEDERFELDILIENNKSLIEILEVAQKRMHLMGREEAKNFKLDECLGSNSKFLFKRALKRLYGCKADDIVEGLTKNPFVAVPVILERLKSKEKEWREAQKSFNKLWREQNEKHYWKSLDHQGINFKQNDFKFIRSKALLREIEHLYEQRRECSMVKNSKNFTPTEARLEFCYPNDSSVFYDVTDLLIHHVKRQSSLQKTEKFKIKKLLKVILPQLFGIQAESLSDDENELYDDDDDDTVSMHSASNDNFYNFHSAASSSAFMKRGGPRFAAAAFQRQQILDGGDGGRAQSACDVRLKEDGATATTTLNAADWLKKSPRKILSPNRLSVRRDSNKKLSSCPYSLMIFCNPWYLFLRLHQILNQRLFKMKRRCQLLIEQNRENLHKLESLPPADVLKCRQKAICPPSEYYCTLIQLIKNVLDGQIDNAQFEDQLRSMFVIHAYHTYTMDKIVQMMVKQLHIIITDETCQNLSDLYEKWGEKGGAGNHPSCTLNCKKFEEKFQQEAEKMVVDENCFKAFFMHDTRKLVIELIKSENDEDQEEDEEDSVNEEESNLEKEESLTQKLASKLEYARQFRECYKNDDYAETGKLHQIVEQLILKPVFMCRNSRKIRSKIALQPLTSRFSSSVTPSSSSQNFTPESKKFKNFLKITYVVRPNELLYRKDALMIAQKSKIKCTERKNRRFSAWHERWTLANVSMDQARLTGDWFMGRDNDISTGGAEPPGSSWIQRVSEPCPRRPPVFAVNRYLSR